MLKAAIIALLLILHNGIVLAQPSPSHPPSPTGGVGTHEPQTESGNSQQQPNANLRGTEQAPFVIKILPPETHQEGAAKPTDEQKSKTQWYQPWIDWALRADPNWALVAVTVILVVVTAWLVGITRGTAKRQLRAYISLEANTIINVAVGQTPGAIFEIKNFGATPAYRVITSVAQLHFDEFALPTGLPALPVLVNRGNDVIGPGSTRRFRTALANPLTPAMVAQLNAGTHAIFCYALVEYRDAFKRRRKTNLRHFVGGPVQLTTLPGMVAHDDGNTQT